jgi:hypothetical protein
MPKCVTAGHQLSSYYTEFPKTNLSKSNTDYMDIRDLWHGKGRLHDILKYFQAALS